MAKTVSNEKGFLVLEMSYEDCKKAGFGDVCDNCIKEMGHDDVWYYIAVLNRLFCRECYEEWYEKAERYEEDIPYEQKRFTAVLDRLGMKWEVKL